MKGTYKTEHKKRNECPKHDNKLSFFCDTCKKGICRDCTVLDHKETAGHIIMDISNADIFHRQALLQQINKWRDSLMQVQNNMQHLEKEEVLLTAAKETTREDIEEFIQHIYEKVEERKQQLIEINKQSFSEAHNFLLSMQKTQKEAIDLINKNINLSEKLVKNGTLDEVIAINQKHTSPTEVIPLDLVELEFGKTCLALNKSKGREAFDSSLSHFGEITFKGFLSAKFAFHCKETSVSQNAELQIQLLCDQGKSLPYATNHFTVEISDPKGTKITSALSTSGREYTVTFTPQMSGQYKVSGMFLGQQLTSEQNYVSMDSLNTQTFYRVPSPFTVQVGLPIGAGSPYRRGEETKSGRMSWDDLLAMRQRQLNIKYRETQRKLLYKS